MLSFLQLLMAAPQGQSGPAAFNFQDFIVIMGIVFFFMWLLVSRPHKKQMQKRREMLKNLKKGDQVMTHAGIFGKVMAVKEKEGKVVIKVDEANNTKITFMLDAVSNVITPEQKAQDRS